MTARPAQPERPRTGLDVRAYHPERADYYRVFDRLSREARERLTFHADLAYGPHARQRLDLFPAGAGAPLVAFLHGGYWHSHDKSEFSFVARPLVAAGIAVAVVNYGLAPDVPVPGIVEHVRSACAWLGEEAGAYGADPDRIFVAGHSAGAHLAAAAALTDWAARGLPPGLVRGGCLVSGIYDLAPLVGLPLNGSIGLDAETARMCSLPPDMPTPRPPELLVAVGGAESEAFRQQSRRFAQGWRASGGGADLLTLPDANHYEAVLAFVDRDGVLVRALVALVANIASSGSGKGVRTLS